MFTLGRSIDIHYPTNRLILILSIISGIVGAFLFSNWLTGLKIAGAIFFAWALSRETDPKREYGAFVSVTISFILIFFTDVFQIAFLELLFVMLILRIINTTSGEQPTLLDAGIIFILVAYHSYTGETAVYLAIYFIGLSLSPIFKEKLLLKRIMIGLASISGLFLLYLLIRHGKLSNELIGPLALFNQVLLYSLFILRDRKKKIYDSAGNLVDSNKILKAQFFMIGITIVFLFLTDPLIANISIYYASTMGVALYAFISQYFHLEDK